MPGLRFKEYGIRLEPGDRLFVYTDGVPEAIDEAVEQYGVDRLLAVLNAFMDAPMQDLLPAVGADIARFKGNADQFDDITMLGFTYRGQAAGDT